MFFNLSMTVVILIHLVHHTSTLKPIERTIPAPFKVYLYRDGIFGRVASLFHVSVTAVEAAILLLVGTVTHM